MSVQKFFVLFCSFFISLKLFQNKNFFKVSAGKNIYAGKNTWRPQNIQVRGKQPCHSYPLDGKSWHSALTKIAEHLFHKMAELPQMPELGLEQLFLSSALEQTCCLPLLLLLLSKSLLHTDSSDHDSIPG